MKKLILASLTAIFLCSACAKNDAQFKQLPKGPIKHHLIVLAKTNNGVKARGFSGATPAGTKIYCEVGDVNNSVMSETNGSFSLSLPKASHSIDYGEFTFVVGDTTSQQGYQVKTLNDALSDVAKIAFNTDREINFIDFAKNHVAILSAEASLVRIFPVDQHWILSEEPTRAVLLNRHNNVALGARMIKNIGNFLITPLFNTHEIALIDQSEGDVISRARVNNQNGQLAHFDVDPPLTVNHAIDADDSDQLATRITKTTARNAEAVIALGHDQLLASFVNYYQFADREHNQSAVVGPGIVALMAIENLELTTKAHLVLPFKNPSFFIKKDDKTIWVLCSGTWRIDSDNNFTSDDAGLVRLSMSPDMTKIIIEHQIPLTNFAAAEPTIVGNKLVVPHSHKNDIAVIDEDAATLLDAHKKAADYHREFNFTFATHWHDDIVFLGNAQGELIAYSLSEGFFPFPFVMPIVLNKAIDRKINLNPLNLYFRHHVDQFSLKDLYPTGYNAWVVTANHQIYPLDFLSVFGP